MSLFGSTSGASLFGSNNQQNQNSQPQPSTGLFGASTNTSQTPQQTGSLFGANTQQQQQPTGSVFGQSTTNTGSSLFGSSQQANTQNQPSQAGSSLFGGLNNQNQTQQTGSSLFGQPQQQQQQQQQQQAPSLFGASANQNNPQQQQQSTGLFGGGSSLNKPAGLSLFPNAAQNQPQQQPQQASLFGASTTNNLQASQQQQQQQVQNRGSLFGSTSRLPAALSLGQGHAAPNPHGQSQQQGTVPGVRIDVSNIRGTTRFNDLHEDLQKQIEQIDNFIQQQISFKEQCAALMPGHEQHIRSIPNDVDWVTNKLNTAELALDNDSQVIADAKGTVGRDAEDARTCFRAIENLKLPQQFHYSALSSSFTASRDKPSAAAASSGTGAGGPGLSGEDDSPRDLISYFNAQAAAFGKTLDGYKQSLAKIEDHLRNVELSAVSQSQQLMFRQTRDGGRRSTDDQTRELQTVLKQFEAGILGVAERVAEVRESVTDVVGQSYSAASTGARFSR